MPRIASFSNVAVVLSAAIAACAEPDPPFGDPNAVLQRRLPNETATPGPAGAAGPFPGEYSATDNPPPPTTTFAAGHAGGKGPAASDELDCLVCHGKDAQASSVKWSFGGRVTVGGAPAKDVDVVVINPDGKSLGPVKSDAEGFFWAANDTGEVVQGAKVYVRTAKGQGKMSTALKPGDGSCDKAGCHTPSGKGKIQAP